MVGVIAKFLERSMQDLLHEKGMRKENRLDTALPAFSLPQTSREITIGGSGQMQTIKQECIQLRIDF
jgi:hypothetical protein